MLKVAFPKFNQVNLIDLWLVVKKGISMSVNGWVPCTIATRFRCLISLLKHGRLKRVASCETLPS
jgi:hypothetical protein